MKKLTCAEAKQVDLVNYLAFLGFHPSKVIRDDHWYHSPLRSERTPSFKVNRRLGVWYDHGLGKGGDLIDLGTLFYKCSIAEFLDKLSQQQKTFSFQQQPSFTTMHSPPSPAGEREKTADNKIIVTATRSLVNRSLINYLLERKISVETGQQYCCEVDFLLYGKQRTAIGFKNDTGGYELRSKNFKGSSSPKSITVIAPQSKELTVFEGFTDLLSFHELNRSQPSSSIGYLILNSLAFISRARVIMERYEKVNLMLDRDKAGKKATAKILGWDKDRYHDQSGYYRQHKDLNDYLCSLPPPHRKAQQLTTDQTLERRKGFKL